MPLMKSKCIMIFYHRWTDTEVHLKNIEAVFEFFVLPGYNESAKIKSIYTGKKKEIHILKPNKKTKTNERPVLF